MKKILIVIGVLVVLLVVTGVVATMLYPDNIAETSPDGGAKGLKTRFYEQSKTEVKKAAVEEINGLSSWGGNWKLIEKDGDDDSIKVEIPVLMFIDDLKVTLNEENGKTRVDVRSKSRVGKSDLGENARNVRKFLAALDNRLK